MTAWSVARSAVQLSLHSPNEMPFYLTKCRRMMDALRKFNVARQGMEVVRLALALLSQIGVRNEYSGNGK